jgi:uncharacterized membrane protein
MSRVLAVSALVMGLSVWAPAYADTAREGDQCEYKKSGARQKLLEQLPAEKETLFDQTMREARKQRAGIRGEIIKARKAAREVLLAPEFNETLFKDKTSKIHDLLEREHQVMEDAIAKLAKQYTPEERKLLAQVFDKSTSHRRWASQRHKM